MSFLRNHVAPTMHNAIGTVVGTAIVASIALIKPWRDAVISIAAQFIPVWCSVLAGLVVAIPFLIYAKRLRTRLKASNDQLKELELQIAQQAAEYEAKLQHQDAEKQVRTTKQLESIVEHQRASTRFKPRRL